MKCWLLRYSLFYCIPFAVVSIIERLPLRGVCTLCTKDGLLNGKHVPLLLGFGWIWDTIYGNYYPEQKCELDGQGSV